MRICNRILCMTNSILETNFSNLQEIFRRVRNSTIATFSLYQEKSKWSTRLTPPNNRHPLYNYEQWTIVRCVSVRIPLIIIEGGRMHEFNSLPIIGSIQIAPIADWRTKSGRCLSDSWHCLPGSSQYSQRQPDKSSWLRAMSQQRLCVSLRRDNSKKKQ